MVVRVSSHRNVRILLVGDRGVGKTSLILSLVSEEFPEDVPHKAEEITIPADVTPEMVPTNIVDYSAVEQTDLQLSEQLQRAHVVCLVYSVADDDTLMRVTTYWLPYIREALSHTRRPPVILVGNKVDLVEYSTVDAACDIMEEFPEVESFVECSAKTLKNISEMFYYAQKAVLHPTGPIYISDRQDLTDECKKALTRIFKVCDMDNDGLLNDAELNSFQKRCFDTPLRPEAMEDVKVVLRKNISGGVSPNNCITLTGFLFLHCLFMQRGRSHTTWTVLRKFGYNENLHMSKEFLFPPIRVPNGCSTELNHKGQQFFTAVFERFDKDKDGALSPFEQESLFSMCPAPPWGSDIKDIVPTNHQGWVTLHGFICFWMLTTLHDLPTTLEYLAYLGYPISDDENQLSAITVTREKRVDLLKRQSTRTVYECHVLGAVTVGKSMLCRSHIGQYLEDVPDWEIQGVTQCTINMVHVYGQEKYLVLKDIDLPNKDAVLHPADVACDVVCLVYDGTNPQSFEYIANVFTKYYQESKVPVMVVCTKADRPQVRQDFTIQPADFCEMHKLSPPHAFTASRDSSAELFVKLATMSAFPRFHAAWLLFYRHTSHLRDLSILSNESIVWKAGLGIAFVAAIGMIVARLIKPASR
ncbi:mitochondrial Rho GTPase isoform X2 [Homalodisca vitripennis]|uniref:mitochondrial Rho GTPase isoform X2 n=1 Tax=Homalodisca vitripennis TaxID=197043 RepID=UPI001EECECED|nr:mitochondrial Rho GTPase isoform X2 [Homalodisca vitripennis]